MRVVNTIRARESIPNYGNLIEQIILDFLTLVLPELQVGSRHPRTPRFLGWFSENKMVKTKYNLLDIHTHS